jgi:hypothetical protein
MTRNHRMFSLYLLAAAAITEPQISQAVDLTRIVSVNLYASNSDYLVFTIHRTELPTFWVVRELLCTVDMATKTGPRVEETFQLTELSPHFFASAPTDAVLYVPHRQSSPRVLSESCVGTSLFASGNDNSNPPVLQTSVGGSDTSENSQSGSSTHSVAAAVSKTGSVASSTKTIRDGKSRSSDERRFLDAVSRLGGATLYEPQAQDVIAELSKAHSTSNVKQHSSNQRYKATPIGPVPPPAKTATGATSGKAVDGLGQPIQTPALALPDSTKPLATGSQSKIGTSTSPGDSSGTDIPSVKNPGAAPGNPEPTNGSADPAALSTASTLVQSHETAPPDLIDPKTSESASTGAPNEKNESSQYSPQNEQMRTNADAAAKQEKKEAAIEAKEAKEDADVAKPGKHTTPKPKKEETSSSEHKRE